MRRIALRIAEEARPRRTQEPAVTLPSQRMSIPNSAAMQPATQSGMFESPEAALRTVFGLLLPQSLPVPQRSPGWHAQRRPHQK